MTVTLTLRVRLPQAESTVTRPLPDRHMAVTGKAAASGEDVFVADAYEDPNFSRAMDEKTGFRTRSVCDLN